MVRYLVLLIGFFPGWLMAQEWEYSPAVRVEGGISSDCEEVLPLLSPDGKTMYFARALCEQNSGGKFTGTDIWVSQLNAAAKTWGAPRNADELNDKANSAMIGLNQTGNVLYMLNTSSAYRPEGIYSATQANGAWSKPKLVTLPGLAPNEYLSAYMAPDESVIIISMGGADSRGKEDLYISLRNSKGEWSAPKNLGSTLNTTGFETSPFLSPDKKRIYFSSNGHPGLGDGDIFYSDRLYDSWDVWSQPKNLGGNVNSSAFDGYFAVYGDSVAYFSSNRGRPSSDIYTVTVSKKKLDDEEDNFKYLSDEEMESITGTVLKPLLYFDLGVSELNDYQRQNLQKINNTLGDKKDIKLNIIALKAGNSSLDTYQQRLLNILDYLKEAGMEGNRIIFSVEQLETAAVSKEMVKIRFYK